MWQFQMGSIIQKKRKEKQLTQEELAKIMGVSKSSVSKWESGQTYPDIYLLPELATYFNISIDALMSHEPQLDKYQIRDIYIELSERFGHENFEEVFKDYDKLVKKYYASSSFLLQMAILLLNYANLVEQERQLELLDYVVGLTRRIKEESKDPNVMTQANVLEGFCHLQLGHVDKTLELLNHDLVVYLGQEQLLAKAYGAKGEIQRAKEVLQVTQYQHLVGLIIISGDELMHEVDNPEKFNAIVSRIKKIAEIYELEYLHPFLLMTFLNNVFIGYTQQHEVDKALKVMAEIVALMVSQTFPVDLHGDPFFYLLDNWMVEQPSINTNMPRDEKTIKLSLIQFYETQPAIKEAYKENQIFIELLQKLKENGGDL